jgi:catechol 2,3-dioxygenase-like lactoylglutathione lyase family enzyme
MTRSHLDHLFVYVTDLAASYEFYVTRLGLTALVEEPGYLRVGGLDHGFYMGMEERHGDHVGSVGIEIVIRVPDVDRLWHELVAADIVISKPEDQAWGARHAWAHDPSGYRISLFSPIPGAD